MKNRLIGLPTLLVTALVCLMGLASCLDDGEETFPLEPGDALALAEGEWRVSQSQLLDPVTGKYVSDMPDDDLLRADVRIEGETVIIDDGYDEWEVDFSTDEEGTYVYLGRRAYRLISLGEGRMVLEAERTVNDEDYIHRYIIDRTAFSDRPEYDDPEDADRNDDESATSVVSSTQSRTIIRGGYTLVVPKGAVPRNSNGDEGRVAFSIQRTGELPAALSSGYTVVEGGGVKAEPMGFTFACPLEFKVPLHGNNANDVTLLRWDEATRRWVVVPWSRINSDGTASVSVLELGQFVLAKKSAATGGIHINSRYIQSGYYYYLTLTPTGSTSGAARSIAFTADGNDLYMAGVPKGTYNATITREARGTTQQASTATETYNEVISVNITNTLTPGSGGYDTYSGWTEITLSGSGWNSGRPVVWGDETVTYGTGKFQATLTWVNESGNTTDYDLHLTTPNGEVYYSNKRAGSFELDRDVISELGNAVENIYSINDTFTAGTYKVRVHHYGGATGKRYNCRILVNGVVVKSVNGVQDSGYADIYSFTIE
ncbi:MAG: hypothetical protein IJS89_04145 [Bacteroidaceae bacterium]|nr:hypothetical protein [Bacteroidaceae bacterium]